MRKALLIGGTGTISMAVTRLLASSGDWEVFILNRGRSAAGLPVGVHALQADIHNEARVRAALGDRRFDVVANFIAFAPEAVERDIGLFAGRTGQYIFISSASAYQKPVMSLPITESTPLHNPFWQYSRDKIACEDRLMRAYRENGFPMTVVRPSHTYNNDNFPVAVRGKQRSWQTLLRIRAGKPVVIPGDGTSLWTVTHADDFAVGFVGLMGNPAAVGNAFHITSDDVLTWNGIYSLVADALGVALNPVHIASDRIAASNPDFIGTLLGDKAHSVVFDTSKIRRFVPCFNPVIQFRDAVHAIVETMQARPELQIPDAEFDAWSGGIIAAEKY